MFEIIRNLLLLLFFFFAGFFLWRYYLQRADEKLRNNPPEKRVIEVALPINTTGSGQDMTRFFRKVASGTITDEKGRKSGLGQLDFAYVATVPAEGATPILKCYIYSDPDKMDAVKKALKSSFSSSVDVIELKDDQLSALARQLRPVKTPATEVEGGIPEEIAGHLPPGLSEEQQMAIMEQIQAGVTEIEIPGELSEETAKALNVEAQEVEQEGFEESFAEEAEEAEVSDVEEPLAGEDGERPNFV